MRELVAFFIAGAARRTAPTRPMAEAAAESVPVGSRSRRADMVELWGAEGLQWMRGMQLGSIVVSDSLEES